MGNLDNDGQMFSGKPFECRSAVYSFHKLYIEVENKVVFYFQNVRSILDDLEKIGYEEDFCEFSQQLGFPSRSRFH